MNSSDNDISQLYKKHSIEMPDQKIDQIILDLANKNEVVRKAIWRRPLPLFTFAASLAVVSLVYMLQQQVPAPLNDLDNQGLSAIQGNNTNQISRSKNRVDENQLKVIDKLAVDIRQSTSEQQKRVAQQVLLNELEKLPPEVLLQIPAVYLSLLREEQQALLLENNQNN